MALKQHVEALIDSKRMLPGVCLASFLESTFVPIPLEALLIPLMQKRREKLWLIAIVTTLGCLFGALVGYAIGYFLFDLTRDWIMAYLTSEAQFSRFESAMNNHGFWFVFSTGITPVPFQLAMIAAGGTKYSLMLYMLAVSLSRSVRYFGLAVLVFYFGDKTEELIRKYKWQAVTIGIIGAVIIISLRIFL